jgi:hypothetical protein
MSQLDKLSDESWNEIFKKFYDEIHTEVMSNLDEMKKNDSYSQSADITKFLTKKPSILSQENATKYINESLKDTLFDMNDDSRINSLSQLFPYYSNLCEDISLINVESLSGANISQIQSKIKKEHSCKCLVSNTDKAILKDLYKAEIVDVVEFMTQDEVVLNYFLDTNNVLWKFAIIP